MFTYKESVIKKTGSKIDVGLLRKMYRILYRRQNKKKYQTSQKRSLTMAVNCVHQIVWFMDHLLKCVSSDKTFLLFKWLKFTAPLGMSVYMYSIKKFVCFILCGCHFFVSPTQKICFFCWHFLANTTHYFAIIRKLQPCPVICTQNFMPKRTPLTKTSFRLHVFTLAFKS